MLNILKRLLFLVIPFFLFLEGYAQQVTKEQLLKLFYKAQTALNSGQIDTAINAYVEVLKLSPGLPDTYLQLGNIYSSMTTDAAALEKACICYANYLKLKPETVDAELLKTKISEMTLGVRQLRGDSAQIPNNLEGFVDKTPVLFAGGILAELPKNPTPKDTLAFNEEKKDTTTVVADTVQVKPVMPIDDAILGRWVSASLGHNGRENWILDLNRVGNDYYFSINDSSFVKKTDEILGKLLSDKVQVNFVANEMIVTFVAEQKKQDTKENKQNSFGILGDLLNDFDLNLFSDSKNSSESNDTIANSDTIKVIDSVIEYSYQFRLAYDGFKLSGVMSHRVTKRDTVETLLSEKNGECEFFKAPDDYLGFTYSPIITVAEKATKMEFRLLLNQKSRESMDNVMALNDLGCMYASGVGSTKNMRMAVSNFKEASMKGSVYGMLNLAKLYVEGVGVDKDLNRARDLYTQAFDKGFSDAMVMCGDTYLISATTSEDYKKALDCYLSAFYRRCPYAYYRLGWLYKEGLGIEKDLEKALEYYQKAVTMQFADALAEMGMFYKVGDMVEKNMVKALELLTKAADKGHANAMYELYQIFLRGDEGVNPNFKYAKDWYSRYLKANDKVIDGYNTVKSQVNAILFPKK